MTSRIKTGLRSLISQIAFNEENTQNHTIESTTAQRIILFRDPRLDSRPGLNMCKEVEEVREFYTQELEKDFSKKYHQELEHYKFLTHGLLHKINATKYFFGEGLESRKNIIFSDDCISTVQIIDRPNEIRLYSHFRSSDLINLLPLDLLALANILRAVIHNHKVDTTDKIISMFVSFGSLHVLGEDLQIARKVAKDAAGLIYKEGFRDKNINDSMIYLE